jgi:hypothetical protein
MHLRSPKSLGKFLTKTALVAAMGLVCCGDTLAEVPEGYPTPRPMGLGGAFTAVANDDSAFWTNPAGIARVRKARSRKTVHILKLPNVTVGLNAASRSFYGAIAGTTSGGVADVIAESDFDAEKPFYARAAAFPSILFDMGKNRPAGFGIFQNSSMRVYIDKDTPTDARVSSVSDLGASFGYAMTDASNRITLGLTLRPTYRYAFEDTIPSSDLKSRTGLYERIKSDNNRGVGMGADVGLLYTLADYWFPTLGLTLRNLPTGCKKDYLNPFTEKRQNICGTKFIGSEGNSEALSIVDPTDARVGMSISPRVSSDYGIRFSADVQNIYLGRNSTYYGLPGIDLAKMLHGGMEIFSGNPLEQSAFALQVGANQGFISWGFTINSTLGSLEFASYAADVSSTLKRVEDRRYLTSFSMSL